MPVHTMKHHSPNAPGISNTVMRYQGAAMAANGGSRTAHHQIRARHGRRLYLNAIRYPVTLFDGTGVHNHVTAMVDLSALWSKHYKEEN